MPAICYVERRFTPDSIAIIDHANELARAARMGRDHAARRT